MTITNLFINRPWAMICVPYLILVIFAVIAFSQGMFDVNTETQDDGLLLSHPILMNDNIIKMAGDSLGENIIEKEAEEELSEKLRHKFVPFMGTTFVLYQNIDKTSPHGLWDIKYVNKMVDMENQFLTYKKANEEFKNTTFNGMELEWKKMCFAGLDGKPVEKPACHK